MSILLLGMGGQQMVVLLAFKPSGREVADTLACYSTALCKVWGWNRVSGMGSHRALRMRAENTGDNTAEDAPVVQPPHRALRMRAEKAGDFTGPSKSEKARAQSYSSEHQQEDNITQATPVLPSADVGEEARGRSIADCVDPGSTAQGAQPDHPSDRGTESTGPYRALRIRARNGPYRALRIRARNG